MNDHRARWDDVELGEMITLHRGYDLPSGRRRDGVIPVVSSSGITGYHDEPKVQPPGVVTGRYGTLGEVFFLEEPFWPLNTTLYVSDFHGNDERFISYFLQCQGLGALDAASAVPGINRNVLHRLPAKRPPLSSQRKIAAILSAYDDLIENNNRRIKLLEEMAERTYRDWFVDFRYPGHANVPLVDSELGPIPQGWRVGTLGDLVDINRSSIRRGDPNEDIRYVDIASVTRGAVATPKKIRLGDAPGRARRRIADGDIIWSTVRPNLRAYALFLSPGNDCVASTGFAVLSPRRASFAYVYAMTTTDAFVEYLVGRATGSAYPAVTPPVFVGAPAVLPGADALQAFADVVEPLLRLASCLRVEGGSLRASRDLVLPRLVSGAVDVTDLDIAGVESAA